MKFLLNILLFILILPIANSYGQVNITAPKTIQIPQTSIDNQTRERLLLASSELDSFIIDYRETLKTTKTEKIPALRIEIAKGMKEILDKYNLTNKQLAEWRKELDIKRSDDLKDPAFSAIVKKLGTKGE